MTEFNGKTYWLVGASAGLGKALAKALAEEGATLILSARSEDKLRELAESLPTDTKVVPLDVTDTDTIDAAMREVGDFDGLVYLAGVYWPMSAQEWHAGHAEAMADVNFAGAIRVMGRVVPHMLRRNEGHIVLTGSLSGFRGLPGAIGYSATKAGVMTLGESMQADLWDTPIDVQIANPGFIRTRLTDKNDFDMPFLMDPDEAAAEILKLMRRRRAYVRHFPWLFSLLFRASRFMPHWLYHRIFA
ncbi:SDR family NAD(P)-dependent oxidoreductase [Roseovarius sp. SCSIO 43702]|uniref:SDR family NAD(P)-dependent oxidoreductase n=1 Tax=Roseovarius sp. SCSIO 43702 TaxID=2823043 RepID=UPI001C72A87C|nr:SDR family NAD(P)-dependent oxidoreductase [Roseovarius sp. SCSIO 43702]QYX57236.1 SDR family NAD(P)-dependent oxidoreductase [Roseovarius sp. SCSIO 43702]